jgi:hypothetical protein
MEFFFSRFVSFMFDAMSDNAPTLLTGESTSYADNIPTRKMRFSLEFDGGSCAIIAQIVERRADFARWVLVWNASCFNPQGKVGRAMIIGFL